MYLEQRLQIEDAERERKFLDSIGPIGRIADNDVKFCVIMLLLLPIAFGIGLLIAGLIWGF
jgi:hypothetical protein